MGKLFSIIMRKHHGKRAEKHMECIVGIPRIVDSMDAHCRAICGILRVECGVALSGGLMP